MSFSGHYTWRALQIGAFEQNNNRPRNHNQNIKMSKSLSEFAEFLPLVTLNLNH